VTIERRIEFPFASNAWRAGLTPWLAFLLGALGLQYGIQVARGDAITPDFWFTLVPILLFAHLVRMGWRRRIRSPRLTLDNDKIRASFSESAAQEVSTERVIEVQVDAKHHLIRFVVPDGISLAVRSDLLEANATGAVDLARRLAGELGVPVVPVRRSLWRWTPEQPPAGV